MEKDEVKIRRKVQLRKKSEEGITPASQGVQDSSTSSVPSSTSLSKKWLWIIPIAVLLLGLVYFLGNGESSESSIAQGETETIQEESPKSEETDTVASDDSIQVSEVDSRVSEVDTSKDEPAKEPLSEVFTKSGTSSVSGDVDSEAMKVIRGDYGDGEERKEKLGSNYQSIQSRVNELKREGVF
jgi:hypothetical protein